MNLTSRALCWGGLPAWHEHCGKERLEPALASTPPFPPPQHCLTLGQVLTGAFYQGKYRNQGLLHNLLLSCSKRQAEVERRGSGRDGTVMLGLHLGDAPTPVLAPG